MAAGPTGPRQTGLDLGMRVSAPATVKVCSLALLLSAWAAGSSLPRAPGPATQDGGAQPEGAQYLPEGEGREVALKACVQCHDLRNTVSQRKAEGGWRRTVNEMIWRGAPLMADEAEALTKYLAESFGPGRPVPDALKKNSAGANR